jgi:hypothetical protein
MLKPCCHCRERRCRRAISPDLLEPIHHLEEGALPPPPPPEWLLKPEHRWTPPPAAVKDWSSCTVVASFPPSVSSVISLQNEFLSTSRACRKKPHCFSCPLPWAWALPIFSHGVSPPMFTLTPSNWGRHASSVHCSTMAQIKRTDTLSLDLFSFVDHRVEDSGFMNPWAGRPLSRGLGPRVRGPIPCEFK